MKVLGKKLLAEFTSAYSDALGWIRNWLADMENSTYKRPIEVKNRYASASILNDNIIIFNVKGNKYRLETKFDYQRESILATWAGTHAEYDKRNQKRKQK